MNKISNWQIPYQLCSSEDKATASRVKRHRSKPNQKAWFSIMACQLSLRSCLCSTCRRISYNKLLIVKFTTGPNNFIYNFLNNLVIYFLFLILTLSIPIMNIKGLVNFCNATWFKYSLILCMKSHDRGNFEKQKYFILVRELIITRLMLLGI